MFEILILLLWGLEKGGIIGVFLLWLFFLFLYVVILLYVFMGLVFGEGGGGVVFFVVIGVIYMRLEFCVWEVEGGFLYVLLFFIGLFMHGEIKRFLFFRGSCLEIWRLLDYYLNGLIREILGNGS